MIIDAIGQARLAAVLEQAPVAIMVVDARTREVAHRNERAERLRVEIGAQAPPSYDASGKRYGPDDWPPIRSLGGEVVQGELIRVEDADATTFFEVSSSPLRDTDGSIVGSIAVYEDATQREQRLEAEREFAATAAHELQTPIAAIIGVTEALITGAKDDPQLADRFLGHLEREARRLDRLSNALLVLARANHAGEPPRLELVPLRPLLETTAGALRSAQTVTVRVECDDDVGVLTHSDVLAQILENLVANAARHTVEGSIVLAARLTGRARAAIEVRDTGGGIATSERARIFGRYEQGGHAPVGSGLGLAIAREAATLIGAQLVLVESSERGTTFSLNLPGGRLVG